MSRDKRSFSTDNKAIGVEKEEEEEEESIAAGKEYIAVRLEKEIERAY